ncbi:MAG: CopG family transcriptional regulator [Gemmatimonadales bacterium]
MIRTQISFDDQQYRALLDAARERGVSMAALVREAVEEKLGDRERERRNRMALSVIGAVRGQPGEAIGRDHDRYLDEAYGAS